MNPEETFATDLGVLVSGLPVVHLTDAEVSRARRIAQSRNRSYVDGRDYVDGGTNYRHDSTDTHRYGVLGEYAVAKWFGLKVDDTEYVGGDGGDDLVIHGERIDVKTRTNSPPWMYAKKSKLDSPDAPDIFYLTEYLDDNHIRLWGSVPISVMVDCPVYDSGHWAFEVENYVLEMPHSDDGVVNQKLSHPAFRAPSRDVHYCESPVCNAHKLVGGATLDLLSIV